MKQPSLPAMLILSAALTNVGNGQPLPSDEQSIRMLVQTFADARNAHDGEAVAALYSEDGEWISANGYFVHGRPALVRLWSGVTGQVARTIQSIDFAGNNIAVVRVVTEYSEPIGRRHETFILVKGGRTWNIRVHQSVD